jgi:Zn-dependent protease
VREEPSALEKLGALEARRKAGQPAAAPGPNRVRQGAIGSIGAGLLLVLVKGKGLLLILLTKLKFFWVFFKLGELATTAWTMLLAVWAYALVYRLPFAALLVLLLFIHELGHAWVARRLGLRVGAPVFIPLFGAYVALKDQPRSTYQESQIGAGGPIAGSAAALACVALGQVFAGHAAGLLVAVGYWALVMNLFNLMPVWQLDGQRMLRPVRPSDGLMVLVLMLLVLVVVTRNRPMNFMALLVILLCAYRFGSAWWRDRRPTQPATALDRLGQVTQAKTAISDHVPPNERLRATVTYAVVASLLIVLVHRLPTLLPDLGSPAPSVVSTSTSPSTM